MRHERQYSPELYDRIRESSKDEVILEEMIRLGFWQRSEGQPSPPEDLIRRAGELNREISELLQAAGALGQSEGAQADAQGAQTRGHGAAQGDQAQTGRGAL